MHSSISALRTDARFRRHHRRPGLEASSALPTLTQTRAASSTTTHLQRYKNGFVAGESSWWFSSRKCGKDELTQPVALAREILPSVLGIAAAAMKDKGLCQ